MSATEPSSADPGAAGALLSPAFLDDPYPVYAQLRATEPVLFLEPMNAWLLTRHEDVKTAFKDDRLGVIFEQYQVNRQGPTVVDEPYFRVGGDLLVCNDPPVHSKLRRIFRQPFTPVRVNELATTVRRLCHEYLDAVQADGRMDVSAQYSALLPLATIGALLDVPLADQPQIGRWVYDFAPVLEATPMPPEQLARVNEAVLGLEDYFTALVAERRATPGEDFISAVVQANDADDSPMSEAELVNNISLLYFAGQDTQKYMFTNMVAALAAHPDDFATLVADATRLPGAVTELYRYDTVGQMMGRGATEDVKIGGRTIAAGQTVMLCMGAANRDPDAFDRPEELVLDRGTRGGADPHITFGAGRHRCMGMHLAQMQIPIMLEVLIERLGQVEVEAGAVRHPSLATRGYDVLPVGWA